MSPEVPADAGERILAIATHRPEARSAIALAAATAIALSRQPAWPLR